MPIIEIEERKLFEKTSGNYFDRNKTLYTNYKDLANRHDCLAFRQIDEDIKNFKFPPHYQEDMDQHTRVINLYEEKRKIRSILRIMVLWSRNKTYEGQSISYFYTQGLISMIHRLLTIATEEESFWILNGVIRSIPRFFSTDVSCLEGGRKSAMRFEMTIFKAILRENLPHICDKLKMFGLPVEQLIYEPITSFYATYFSSDIVLRLWDLIIFNLSNKDKNERKRAVWHLLAPAYLIFREKKDDIMNAMTIQ